MWQSSPVPTLDEIAASAGVAAALPLPIIAALDTVLAILPAAHLEHEASKENEASEDSLLEVAEVASVLGLARSYVYELAPTNQLPAVRVGRYIRIKACEVR